MSAPERTPQELGLMAALQMALGHEFADASLLERALTHASFRNEFAGNILDNERLEFLGDAVLQLTVSELLFREYPDLPEGRLTQLRAHNVSAPALSSIAKKLSLGVILRLGVGEARTGGRGRPSILADAFEAVMGAIFMDAGFSVAQTVVRRIYRGRFARLDAKAPRDAKSRLQEWAQGTHHITPTYTIVGTDGPDHESVFEAEVTVGDTVRARGRGPSKKAAQQDAATEALVQLAPSDP